MTRTRPLEYYTDTNDVPEHESARRIIHDVLTTEARGRDNAVSSAALAEYTPVSASTVRDLVPEVRRRYDVPIGSCSKGYFVIVDEAVFRRQVERQKMQAEVSLCRAREIAAAWNRGRVNER